MLLLLGGEGVLLAAKPCKGHCLLLRNLRGDRWDCNALGRMGEREGKRDGGWIIDDGLLELLLLPWLLGCVGAFFGTVGLRLQS